MEKTGAAMLRRALLTVGIATLAGCTEGVHLGPPVHETKVLELDKSELTRVELKMGAGELRVNGGTPKLMEGDFTYNVAGWKPQMSEMMVDFPAPEAPTSAVTEPASAWKLMSCRTGVPGT